jgi:hypothetical protein
VLRLSASGSGQALEGGLGSLEAGQGEGLRRLARDVAAGLEDAEASLLVRAPLAPVAPALALRGGLAALRGEPDPSPRAVVTRG